MKKKYRFILLLTITAVLYNCHSNKIVLQNWTKEKYKYIPDDVDKSSLLVVIYEFPDWIKHVTKKKKYWEYYTDKSQNRIMQRYNAYIQKSFKNYKYDYKFITSSEINKILDSKDYKYILEAQYDTLPYHGEPAHSFNYLYTPCPFFYDLENKREYSPINKAKFINKELPFLYYKNKWEF